MSSVFRTFFEIGFALGISIFLSCVFPTYLLVKFSNKTKGKKVIKNEVK